MRQAVRAIVYLLVALLVFGGLPLFAFTLAATESKATLYFYGVMQQTTAKTYYYIIRVSGSYCQITNGTTEQIIYQSTDATQVINTAIGNIAPNNSILFSSGTYNLKGSITVTNKNDITLTFESGATLFVSNGMNAPAIKLANCNNCLIKSVTVNGNAANQADLNAGAGSHGISIEGSQNIHVDGANIYNVRTFGFAAQLSTNVGITNSKITNCGWNGILLGGMSGGQIDSFAINNEVAYCSDVGISTYGVSSFIQNNYVHDMNGTTGYNNARWGIAVEAGSNNTITGNTAKNCDYGIVVGFGSNVISSNTILGVVKNGIHVGANDDGNTVTDNSVIDWNKGSAYGYGVYVSGDGNTVSNNVLNTTYSTDAIGMYVTGSYNQILGNRINVGENRNHIVDVAGGTENIIANNIITGGNTGFGSAIVIRVGVIGTIIKNNDLTQCANTKISNSGVATSIYTNPGYNPIGYIANPIAGSTAYLVDSGSNSTWISGRVYTNTESPKVLNISGGTVSVVAQNGVTVFTTTNCTVTLQPGDTFSVTFSTTPTINAIGQ